MKSPLAALLLALSFSALSHAQTLARPGWAGSGLNVQPWWKHAVIYEIDPRSFQDSNGDGTGDFKGIAQRLDYLKSVGVDAILLDSVTIAMSANTVAPIDPAIGSLDDFDELSREAGRRNIRILLSLAPAENGGESSLPVARFWLSRGVAGLRLAGSADNFPGLRKLVSSYAGQRILITDAGVAGGSSGGLVVDASMLSIKAQEGAPGATSIAAVRVAMEQSQAISRGGAALLATDGPGVARSVDRFSGKSHNAGIAKIIGTILLLNRSVPLIYAGQEVGLHSPSGEAVAMPWGAPPVAEKPESQPLPAVSAPAPASPSPAITAPSEKYVPYVAPVPKAKTAPLPCDGCTNGQPAIAADPKSVAAQDSDSKSVLNFYRQLSTLHHGNAALRDGEQITLNHDDLNALVWIRRTASVTPLTPAVVVVCNLSDRPLVLPLKAELARLHLRGSFLRTLLRSDDGMGSMHLEPITVPPYGVYVGELRY